MSDDNLSNGYLLTKGVLILDSKNYVDEIIPIWDSRITYEDHDLYGRSYCINNKRQELRDILFNISTKELSLGIELNMYPQDSDFKIGQTVYAKVGDSVYKSSIKDILYTEYKITVYRGRDMDKYYISHINKQHPDIEITIDGLYCIKDWIPYYLLENNNVVKWRHELFKEFIVK